MHRNLKKYNFIYGLKSLQKLYVCYRNKMVKYVKKILEKINLV